MENESCREIFVVGPGAVGRALAEVERATLLSRTDKLERVRSPVEMIIATKAYDCEQAILDRLVDVPSGSTILIASNGHLLEILQRMENLRPDIFWGFCIVSFGARLEDGRLRVSGYATNAVQKGLLRKDSDVVQISQKKWLFNATLNTLTCAYSLPRNGLALDYLPELKELFGESCALSELRHGKISASHDDLWTELLTLIRNTAQNENSMARDRRLFKRTEADFFSGLAIGLDGFPLLKSFHFACSGL